MEFNNQIFHYNKNLPIDPVFSNWVNFIRNVSIISCGRNLKSFKAIIFVLGSSTGAIFSSKSVFFFVYLR